jgi:hypothetical protein
MFENGATKGDGGDDCRGSFEKDEGQELDQVGGPAGERGADEIEAEIRGTVGGQPAKQVQEKRQQ